MEREFRIERNFLMGNKFKNKAVLTTSFLFFLFFLFGCGLINTDVADPEDDRINIVATTTMITDLLEVIGGEQVNVQGLMGPGIDPHGYQASASDVDKMFQADIVAYNGLDLEGQMGRVFSELGNMNKEVFVMEEAVEQTFILDSDDEDLNVDPHIWFSVPLWSEAADYVTDALSDYDPVNASYYAENNETYQAELEDLDHYIRRRTEEVNEQSRYLITAHDAFKYFGDEYGFEVIGLQGLNTQTEAGTRDVSNLAQFIVENEINAIFIETSVPTRTIESLQEAVQQRGWEVEIGGELYSDALGDASQDAETYLKMYKQNIDTIVDALK